MKALLTLFLALSISAALAEEVTEPPFLQKGAKYIIQFADGSKETLEVIKRKGESDWYLVKGTGLISHPYYINIGQALSVTFVSDKKEEKPAPPPQS